jgi:hypothetical protein
MAREVPTKTDLRFFAYADESVTDEIVACAAAVFPIERISQAEAALAATKESLGLTAEIPLHCRLIFSGEAARRGTPWASVAPEAIYSAVLKLCNDFHGIGQQPVVFVTPAISPPTIPGPPGKESRVTELDTKGVAALGFQAINFHLVQKFGYGAVEVWIDPDKTKIPWLGAQRRQANSTRSGFADLGPAVEPPLLTPNVKSDPKPRLLEVADLYSYVASHAHSEKGGWKTKWFQEAYGIICPERIGFVPNPDTKWEKA